MSKHLLLLRHAKSSWDHPGLGDHQRPLNARGRRDAPRIGAYLRERGIVPDLVMCSSAVRTRATLEGLALLPPPEVVVDTALYGASGGEMLGAVRAVDDGFERVMLVTHNPGTHALAMALVDDPTRIPTYPTAALTSLVFPVGSWADVRQGHGVLDAFVTPRLLERSDVAEA